MTASEPMDCDNSECAFEQKKLDKHSETVQIWTQPETPHIKGEKRRRSRLRPWVILIAVVLVQVSLGISFSFGNYMPYLTSYLRNMTGDTSLDYSQSLWIDNSNWMACAATMPLFGLVERRMPHRFFLFIGFLFFSFSFFGSYWTVQTSFATTVLALGVMQGVGVAVLWPGSYNIALMWFTEKKGFVGGIAMAGYGCGAFAWNQIITHWINPNNIQPDLHINEDVYFTQPEVLQKVPSCFLLLGGVLSGILVLSLVVLSEPPDNGLEPTSQREDCSQAEEERSLAEPKKMLCTARLDKNSVPEQIELTLLAADVDVRTVMERSTESEAVPDYTPLQILRSRAAWTTWFFNFSTDISYVFVVSFYKTYGQTFIRDDRFLSLTGSFAALSNALGRLLLGCLADRLGLMCMLLSQGLLTLSAAAILACEYAGEVLYFIVINAVFAAYGGLYSLQSLIVFTMFGPRFFTFSFGFVSTSPLLSYLLPVFVSSAAKDAFGWTGVFLAGAAAVFVGLMLNASLLLDCGHPIPDHMKRDLFARTCKCSRKRSCFCR